MSDDRKYRIVTRAEAKSLVSVLVKSYQALDTAWDAVAKQTGMAADSPFGNAVWKSFEQYAEAVSQVVGDDFGSVSWYIWDNECGKRGMQFSLPDGSMRAVRSIDDLLDVIEF